MSADDKTRILPDSANTNVGTQLSGIYELDERIACGGMGEVYRGHNIQTGDHVAIKIVLPEFARDQTILSLFRKEASILNHLSHDAVVRYHVFTVDPGIGRPYLAMEFVDGESLLAVMRRGAMSTDGVRKLCHRLASGLNAVHEAGAIHRDLSPDNIILPGGRVERAKIIDFGIARSGTVGGETLIGGKFAGKYNYVSPEQLGLYGGEVSERSDIYSLGLVLAAALRGTPIEMSGSQYEIVEKRRTVPDLSDIDGDFRPVIEAMLQPDPRERPARMAEIARMARSGLPTEIDETMAPGPARDRQTARPQAEQPASASPNSERPISTPPLSKGAGEPRFVPHARPAHLSQPRPATPAAPRAITPKANPKKSANTRNIAIAGLAAVIVTSYLGDFLPSWRQPSASNSGETSRLTPDLSKPSATETVAPGNQPAEEIAPPRMQTEEAATPSGNQPDVANSQGQEAAQPADEIAKPHLTTDEILERLLDPNGQSGMAERPGDKTAAAPSLTEGTLAPSATHRDAANSRPHESTQPASEPANSQAQAEVRVPSVDQPSVANDQNQKIDQLTGDEQPETDVAINVPKPQAPPADTIDGVADRISWLRDYRGGDCFYAAATSVTDKAVEIEGFGTAVEPFMEMMGAFQAKFHLEPDISVRLIEPTQCEVARFLRALGASAAAKPKLALDQTSVPNGFPISGTFETHGGLRSSLLLIDHKGMAFNLDDRVTVQSGKAFFSIPIGLGATDQAASKVVPQIIVVVTGAEDIRAAAFSTPTPATVALPKILAEIMEKRLEFSATAKYFRLGG